MKVRLDHLQPSPIGATLVAEAVLQRVEGRRLTFTVSAYDDRGLVAVGQVVRVVVEVERFLTKCGAERSAADAALVALGYCKQNSLPSMSCIT